MELEGNKRASRSRYVQSRTTPSRSTGSGLKQRLLVARFGPLSSRRGAAMLPVKPASFPRRVRTSRERTARRRFSDGAPSARCSEHPCFCSSTTGRTKNTSRLSFRHAGLHTQLALRNGSPLFEFLNIISAHIFVRITRSD